LLLDNAASASAPDLSFDGDANTGIYSPGADQLAIATNGTGRLFVDASGDVGVGTSSPGRKLSVHSTSSNANFLQVTNSTTGSGASDGAIFGIGNDEALIIYQQENNYLALGTNNTERLRIDSSGNVGIGNTAPAYKLSVLTTGTSDTSLHLATTGGASGNGLATNSVRFTGGNNTRWANAKYEAFAHIFNGNGAEQMRIDSSGRLGVGTSSPTTILHTKTATASGYIIAENSSNHQWIFGPINATYAQVGGLYGTHSGIAVDLTGNVGIGITSPGEILEIYDTAPTIKVYGESNSGANSLYSSFNGSDFRVGIENSAGSLGYGGSAYARYLYSTGAYPLVISVNGGEAARIDSSKRLLVGTSSDLSGGDADARLQVNGDAGAQILLSRQDFGALTADTLIGEVVFRSQASGVQETSALIKCEADATQGSGDKPGRLVFSTTADSASSPTERMRIDKTGNVFVGGSTGYLVAEYSDSISNGENLTITFAGASNSHRGQNIFQITYCNHTNNSGTLYAASFIVTIRDSVTTGYNLSIIDFQSIYNVNSTVGAIGDLTFVDNGDGTATLALPNKVGAGGNAGNTAARVTIQRLCSGFGLAMYPTQAVAV